MFDYDWLTIFYIVAVGVTGHWQLSAGAHYQGYSALPTEATIVNSPVADRVAPKQQLTERKSLSQHNRASSIDVPARTMDRFLDASKSRSLDTPSKITVKLGHDHTLLQAASTQDYWWALTIDFVFKSWCLSYKDILTVACSHHSLKVHVTSGIYVETWSFGLDLLQACTSYPLCVCRMSADCCSVVSK